MAHFGACGVPHGRILGWSLVALEVVLVPAQQDLCSLSLEMMIKSCLVWLDQVSYHALCPVSQLWFFHGVLVFLYTYTLKESDALVQTCAHVAYNQKRKNPCVRIVK